jgi:biopolymer transport protein ExbB
MTSFKPGNALREEMKASLRGAMAAAILMVAGAALAQDVAPPGANPTPVQGGQAAPVAPPTPAIPAPVVQTTPVAVENSSPPAARMPHDLSPWGMFMAADIVVKVVMLGLAFASLVTWTVWLAKSLELLGAKRRARRAVDALAGASGLREARNQIGRSAAPSRP